MKNYLIVPCFFFAFFFTLPVYSQMFDQLQPPETTRRHAPAKVYMDRMKTPLLSMFAAGVLDGAGDRMKDKHSSSIFYNWSEYWNPSESWKYKYRNWPTDQRERFPGSKTILVGFTDGWHLTKSAKLTAYQISVVSYKPRKERKFSGYLLDAIALKVAHGVGWHLADIVTTRRN